MLVYNLLQLMHSGMELPISAPVLKARDIATLNLVVFIAIECKSSLW
jgi:hypothetical protein